MQRLFFGTVNNIANFDPVIFGRFGWGRTFGLLLRCSLVSDAISSAIPPTILALTYRAADAIVSRYLKNPTALA